MALALQLRRGVVTQCNAGSPASAGRILITFAYEEQDQTQTDNFDYFMRVAPVSHARLELITWVYVVALGPCTPCAAWGDSTPATAAQKAIGLRAVGRATPPSNATVLYRSTVAGTSMASYNVSLEYQRLTGQLRSYAFFFLVDSTARGPFAPRYMPPTWHWTDAFTAPMAEPGSGVRAVGASLVCLPVIDEDGPGPRLEGWALAVDAQGMRIAVERGALAVHTCLGPCNGTNSVPARGSEFAISAALLQSGHNIATLLAKYAAGVDWNDLHHWACNDGVHPSRESTYDTISMTPFETVFIRAAWHVSERITAMYTKWRLAHLGGNPGTAGKFNEELYKYAISKAAQNPFGMDAAFDRGWTR